MGSRLLAAQLLVLTAGILTVAVVASTVGPPLFRDHAREAFGVLTPAVKAHLFDTFGSALAIALAVAAAAGLGTAVAVSVFVTRRITRPVTELGSVAVRVTDGDYTARAPGAGLGPEFDALATAFNAMAEALANTETTRRAAARRVAHELRTPLATLDAYLEGLADGVVAPEPATWATMHAQTARLRRLAEDIGTVSRAEEHQTVMQLRPIPPSVLLESAAAAATPRYQTKGVRLTTWVEPGVPPVAVDPDRLGEVLTNLLDNALQHSAAGDIVQLAARQDADGVRLSVTDTGDGIAAEHLAHLFERFYRADHARDRARGGSGIGLAITRALVHAHHGTITASSPGPGHGATFTVTLPTPLRPEHHR